MKYPGRRNKIGNGRENWERGIAEAKYAFRKMIFKLALNLQDMTTNISLASFRVILIAFFLTWGVFNTYLIWQSFDSQASSITGIQKILLPKHFYETGENHRIYSPTRDSGTSRVQMFIDSMNILKNSSQGSRIYDSILQSRPQLLDSIQQMELLQSK